MRRIGRKRLRARRDHGGPPTHDVHAEDWAAILKGIDSARGAARGGGDPMLIVRLPNRLLWAFNVLPRGDEGFVDRDMKGERS